MLRYENGDPTDEFLKCLVNTTGIFSINEASRSGVFNPYGVRQYVKMFKHGIELNDYYFGLSVYLNKTVEDQVNDILNSINRGYNGTSGFGSNMIWLSVMNTSDFYPTNVTDEKLR